MCHCAARRLREVEEIRSGRVQDGRRRAVAPLPLTTGYSIGCSARLGRMQRGARCDVRADVSRVR